MNWLRRLMYGRYGGDPLGLVLCGLGLLLALLSALFSSFILRLCSFAVYAYCLFRMVSRNIYRRQRENQWFFEKITPLLRWFRLQKKRFDDRKQYRYFTCPHCGQHVRVPRGRGKIRIICPKCKQEFTRKS